MTADDDIADDAMVDTGIEVRADQAEESELRDHTVVTDHFDKVHHALVRRGAVLIQGPRGCGKTHLMRYTWLQCRDNAELPLAIYVSFNRYLRLEPLLHRSSDAIAAFHGWVLGSLLIEANKLSKMLDPDDALDIPALLGLTQQDLTGLIDRLERQLPRSETDETTLRALSIDSVAEAIVRMCQYYERTRAVVLMDDAALTLTPEYMVEFFDIVRVLKRSKISPKISVYPGTTEFGPRFHANHEAEIVSAWIPVDSGNYVADMRNIAQRRYPESNELPCDALDLLALAAFGIPRAYLTMTRKFQETVQREKDGSISATRSLSAFMEVVQAHNKLRLAEYGSLGKKMPKFNTLIETGGDLFGEMVEAIRKDNDRLMSDGKPEKQIIVGIEAGSMPSMVDRMLKLLVEAGLVYEYPTDVSHGGTERTYRRFTPDIATLLAERAFSAGHRGSSVRLMLDAMQRRSTKHPVRRTAKTLLGEERISNLRFDLPPCQNCNAIRINEEQKFCHQCGAKLVEQSTFEQCMNAPLSDVQGLTDFLVERLETKEVRTVFEFETLHDPSNDLRSISGIGKGRTTRIITAIRSHIEEYLT